MPAQGLLVGGRPGGRPAIGGALLTASAVTGTRRAPSANVASAAGTIECRVPNRPVLTATQVGAPVRSSAKNASTVPSLPPSAP